MSNGIIPYFEIFPKPDSKSKYLIMKKYTTNKI